MEGLARLEYKTRKEFWYYLQVSQLNQQNTFMAWTSMHNPANAIRHN
jgi:hypothetical protein